MTDILEELGRIVGENGVLTGEDVTARGLNFMGLGAREARAIVRPRSTKEVSEVLRLCHAREQSVVTLGGLTGLVQGTDSTADDLVLSLERMRAIGPIDVLGKTMVVEAGAPLQSVQEAAAEQGLMFALDLGARGSCTIGGNISTNAGGNQVIRYGMMREQVLGLEVVLADGTIISSMNTLLKNNTGYDLKQLFIGAEGTLGIVTRAVLRLHPQPKSANTALAAVADFDRLARFFTFAGAELGAHMVSFEVMWRDHYELIAVNSGRHTPPLPGGHAYYVVIEQQGTHPERDGENFSEMLGKALEDGLVEDVVLAQSKAQAQAIWDIREDIEGLFMALMPGFVYDVSLPIKDMDTYTTDLKTAVQARWGEQAKVIIFGHLGDCNLHIVVSVGDGSEEARAASNDLVYGPLQALGGSVSAEHGIGLEKKPYLHLSRAPAELALMKTLKQTLDPKGILNPGKVF